MIRVLIAGFGRFPGAPFNPTAALARRLAARRRPALVDVSRIAHVFRTSYAAVENELPKLIARHEPDAILLLGLAGRTPYVRVETRAQNRLSLLFPDVDGRVPQRAPIRLATSALTGRAPFRRLLAAAKSAHVPTRLSRDAGRYLCNFAYWRAIEETARKKQPPLVAFVHVPLVGSPLVRSGPRRRGKRRLSAADLARAGEAILVALAAAARAAALT
jgi:pyroglutamyl-peptidase